MARNTALISYRAGQRSIIKGRARHRRANFTIPLAPVAGLMVGLTPAIEKLIAGQPASALRDVQYRFTPWDPWKRTFSTSGLKTGLYPLIGGIMVHKIFGQWLGINRMLGRAKVPIFRL